MIDTSVESKCKFCGQPVEQVPGRRKREFCNDACRQRHHRAKKQAPHEQDQAQGTTFTAMLSELVESRTKVADQAATIEQQAQTIEELEQQVMRLQNRLDVDRRYHGDHSVYSFPAWLKKQPASPLRDKLLAAQLLPSRASRAKYEPYLRYKLHCTPEEMDEFTHLWKLMLLS